MGAVLCLSEHKAWAWMKSPRSECTEGRGFFLSALTSQALQYLEIWEVRRNQQRRLERNIQRGRRTKNSIIY